MNNKSVIYSIIIINIVNSYISTSKIQHKHDKYSFLWAGVIVNEPWRSRASSRVPYNHYH